MHALKTAVAAILVVGSLAAVGCAKKASSSSEAIQHAQTLKTPEEQANYLLAQAKAFLNSKEYQEAIATARHIVSKYQGQADEAQQVLAKASEQMAGDAKAAAGDAAKKLGL